MFDPFSLTFNHHHQLQQHKQHQQHQKHHLHQQYHQHHLHHQHHQQQLDKALILNLIECFHIFQSQNETHSFTFEIALRFGLPKLYFVQNVRPEPRLECTLIDCPLDLRMIMLIMLMMMKMRLVMMMMKMRLMILIIMMKMVQVMMMIRVN